MEYTRTYQRPPEIGPLNEEAQNLQNKIVVCCCKLNNIRICDEHLSGQDSTHTGLYQLPAFRCPIVHLLRWACLHFRRAIY